MFYAVASDTQCFSIYAVLSANECDNRTTKCEQNCVWNATSSEDICSCNIGFRLSADGFSCDGKS